MQGLPETSPWADRYGCGRKRARARRASTTSPGYVWTMAKPAAQPGAGAQAAARNGPGLRLSRLPGGRLVADVLRLDKGHTEGLEPKITEKLIQMMVAARGGKLRAG